MPISSTRLLSLMRLLIVSSLRGSSNSEHVGAGLVRGYMEPLWEGSGDGAAITRGLVVRSVRICDENALCSLTPLNLFDRLYLNDNYLTALPDCIGQLTNLTEYVIQFGIPF